MIRVNAGLIHEENQRLFFLGARGDLWVFLVLPALRQRRILLPCPVQRPPRTKPKPLHHAPNRDFGQLDLEAPDDQLLDDCECPQRVAELQLQRVLLADDAAELLSLFALRYDVEIARVECRLAHANKLNHIRDAYLICQSASAACETATRQLQIGEVNAAALILPLNQEVGLTGVPEPSQSPMVQYDATGSEGVCQCIRICV